MSYYDNREALVQIAGALVDNGWTIFGYKEDTSDMMTDYWNPASWDGVATKNGYVLIIDNHSNSKSGYEVKKYNYNKTTYKASDRIVKLTAMMNDPASTENEKASCAALIEKEKEKQGIAPQYTVIETYPTFVHGNPKHNNWHIEKDGQILAKGSGAFAVNSYDWENKEKTAVEQKAEKLAKFTAKIEKVLTDSDALETEIVKVAKTVTKPVEKDNNEVNEGDILSFSYHGGFWIVNSVYERSGKKAVTYELLGSEKRGYQRTKNGKRYYQYLTQLQKEMEAGKVKVYTIQEVTEYVEKIVFTKTKRTQKASDAVQIESNEAVTEQPETAQEAAQTVNTVNNSDNKDQATKRQLWALHVVTKLNTTNLVITKAQASELISKSKAGHDVTEDIKAYMNADTSNNSEQSTEQEEVAQEPVSDVVTAETAEYNYEQLEAITDAILDYTTDLMTDWETVSAKRPETAEEKEEFKNNLYNYMTENGYSISAITAHVKMHYAGCVALLEALESLNASQTANNSQTTEEPTKEEAKEEAVIINGKITVKEITFIWSESRFISDGLTVSTFSEAEQLIKQAAKKVNGGYDKTKFCITWTDGDTYTGRIDIDNNHLEQRTPIKDHINDWLLFLTGDKKPSHMTEKAYTDTLTMYNISENEKQEYYDFLERYALTDINTDHDNSRAKEEPAEVNNNVIYHNFNSTDNEKQEENEPMNVNTFDDIMSKFDNIEVTTNDKVSAEDLEFCKEQQTIYDMTIGAYNSLNDALQAVKPIAEEHGKKYGELRSGNYHAKGSAYDSGFNVWDLEKNATKIKERFISTVCYYFMSKYNITVDYEKIQKKYDTKVNYINLIDEIMLQLGGYNFTEKATQEIKVNASNTVRNEKTTIKNTKLILDGHYSYLDRWDGYKLSGGYEKVLTALQHYEDGSTSGNPELTDKYIGYKNERNQSNFERYEPTTMSKVKSIKFLKNGKLEIEFTSNQQASKFAAEYCGYRQQTA